MFEDVIKTWLLTFDFLFDDSADHNFLWSVCDMWSIKYLMLNISGPGSRMVDIREL